MTPSMSSAPDSPSASLTLTSESCKLGMLLRGDATRLAEAAAWLLLAAPRGFLAVLAGLVVPTLAALP